MSEISDNPVVLRLGRWKVGECETESLKSVPVTVEECLFLIKYIKDILIFTNTIYWLKIFNIFNKYTVLV